MRRASGVVSEVASSGGTQESVDVRRRVVATLAKTLLPLGLMALIMFASLYFPTALVKEKVTVAIPLSLIAGEAVVTIALHDAAKRPLQWVQGAAAGSP